MDKGTLLTNGNSYSGDGGTLIVNGISYSGGVVESGGVDVSDTTAIENDVKQGKVFYLADGSKALGQYLPPVVPTLSTKDVRVESLQDAGVIAPSNSGWNHVSYGLSEEEKAKVIPGNIKSGVEILGVQGYYVGHEHWAWDVSHTSTSETIEVYCGFKPKYIALTQGSTSSDNASAVRVYDSYRNPAKQYTNGTAYDFPTTTANRIGNVTETGFTLTKTSSAGTVSWFAVG